MYKRKQLRKSCKTLVLEILQHQDYLHKLKTISSKETLKRIFCIEKCYIVLMLHSFTADVIIELNVSYYI